MTLAPPVLLSDRNERGLVGRAGGYSVPSGQGGDEAAGLELRKACRITVMDRYIGMGYGHVL